VIREDQILAFCRGATGTLCMRTAPDGACLVAPMGYVSIGQPIAVAPSWDEVYAALCVSGRLDAYEAARAEPEPGPLTGIYRKRHDGSWGVQITSGTPVVGATVKVRKRSGEIKAETIATVGPVCAIEPTERPARSYGRRSRYTRFNSGAEVWQNERGRCIDAPCCGCCS